MRNRGDVIRTKNGYVGQINIENVIMDVVCTFWSNNSPNFIWLQRIKEKKFNVLSNEFIDFTPKPFFECYAYKQKKKHRFEYKGEFIFVGFKYILYAWFEDNTEHQLNFAVERDDKQPVLERLNQLNKERNEKIN